MSPVPLARLRRWWEKTVHHGVHPTSAILVLAAAALELWEWVAHLAEHLAHVLEGGGHP